MLTELEELIDRFITMHLTENSRNGLGKFKEEVEEFTDMPGLPEGADVIICVMIELRRSGISLEDLLAAAYAKMLINLARTWEVQPDGTLHHVKDDGSVFCEHEPYRDDTKDAFVVKCRKCPAESHMFAFWGIEPILLRYMISEEGG